ncbi:MAG: hypothetical protein ACP6IQ_01970 [Candidatus Njordarchaeia archaeon]
MHIVKNILPVPLFILQKDDKVEDINSDFCYILANQGLFLKKKNFLYTSISKVDKIAGLPEVEQTSEIIPIKMQEKFFLHIRAFFQAVYDKFQTEAAVLLYYNPSKKLWAYLVPKQTVTSGGVKYEVDTTSKIVIEPSLKIINKIPKDFVQIGSIHSHAGMSAFHSGIDDNDEFNFDGLHITIGNFNDKAYTYAVRWIINGQSITKSISDIIETERIKINDTLLSLVNKPELSGKSYSGYYNTYFSKKRNDLYSQKRKTAKPKAPYPGYGYYCSPYQDNLEEKEAVEELFSEAEEIQAKELSKKIGFTVVR